MFDLVGYKVSKLFRARQEKQLLAFVEGLVTDYASTIAGVSAEALKDRQLVATQLDTQLKSIQADVADLQVTP